MNNKPILNGSLKLILAVSLALAIAPASSVTASEDSPTAVWKYTAVGDSLAAGMWAVLGYVPRYQIYTAVDNRMGVSSTNLGRPGWKSGDLLLALRTNPAFRTSIQLSDIVTWDIGGNDLLSARSTYKARRCGGADNQDCLRSTVARFKSNWDAIIGEILGLRSTSNTIIRTMDLYNPYVKEDMAADTWADDGGLNDFQVFKPYLDDVNSYIGATATNNNIPYARVYQAFNGPNGDQDPEDKGYLSFDGLHPNDVGHRVIADQLRALGYAPLR